MRILFALSLCLCVVGCGGSSGGGAAGRRARPKPGEDAFRAASSLIISKSEGTAHGDTDEAKEMAQKYSEVLKVMQEKSFTGGKENRRFSLTGEDFLTYCRINDSSVVFLVHVPQLKRYKGEVRDSLLEIAWLIADQITEGHPQADDLEIAVGLKGTAVFGGSAVGKRGGEPQYENAFIIDETVFFKFFAAQ